jgi:aryl-alcohol dehydrogenase-like predicted oxidoreductase
VPIYKDYFTDRAFAVVDVLRAAAKDAGMKPAVLALAWQLAKPEISSVIIGARTIAQLDDNLEASGAAIPPAIYERLEEATRPAEEYPNSMISWIQKGLDPRAKS